MPCLHGSLPGISLRAVEFCCAEVSFPGGLEPTGLEVWSGFPTNPTRTIQIPNHQSNHKGNLTKAWGLCPDRQRECLGGLRSQEGVRELLSRACRLGVRRHVAGDPPCCANGYSTVEIGAFICMVFEWTMKGLFFFSKHVQGVVSQDSPSRCKYNKCTYTLAYVWIGLRIACWRANTKHPTLSVWANRGDTPCLRHLDQSEVLLRTRDAGPGISQIRHRTPDRPSWRFSCGLFSLLV